MLGHTLHHVSSHYTAGRRKRSEKAWENGRKRRKNWVEEGKPVACIAHYKQTADQQKITQTIILNGISCQIQ